MISIGINEIQNNIFLNLTDVVEIVDKNKKEVLAFVYPVRKEKKNKKDIAFGIWEDKSDNVKEYVENLRKGRSFE
jgi:hypothetical protein